MAKAVNQNDLVDIIKAQVESLGDIMAVVFSAVNDKKFNIQGDIYFKMKDFQEKLNVIFGERGFIDDLNSYIKRLNVFNKYDKKVIKKSFENIQDILLQCNSISMHIDGLFLKNGFQNMVSSLKNIQMFLNALSNLNTPRFLWFKMMLLKWNFKRIYKLFKYLGEKFSIKNTIEVLKATASLLSYKIVCENISKIFQYIIDTKSPIKLWFKIKRIKFFLKRIYKLAEYIGVKFGRHYSIIMKSAVSLLSVAVVFTAIRYIFDLVKRIKSGFFMFFYLWRVRRALKHINKIIKYIRALPRLVNPGGVLKTFIVVFLALRLLSPILILIRKLKTKKIAKRSKKIIDSLRWIKCIIDYMDSKRFRLNIRTYKHIRKNILRICKVIRYFRKKLIGEIFKTGGLALIVLPLMTSLLLFAGGVKVLTVILNSIRVKRSTPRKLRTIRRCIRLMQSIIRRIARIRRLFKAIGKLMLLSLLFTTLAILFTVIILTATIAPFAIIALVILGLFIVSLGIFLFILVLLFKLIPGKVLVKTLLSLIAIILVFAIISMLLLEFIENVLAIKDNMWSTLEFLGFLVVFIVLVTAIGWLVNFASPIILPAIVGLLIIFALMLVVVLIMGCFWLIQKMDLNKELIEKNIRTVFDSLKLMITLFYEDDTKEPTKKGEKSWLESLFMSVGKAFLGIVQAVMMVAFLLVSVILILLLLAVAGLLWLIQGINLDKELIKNRIDTVIDSVKYLMDKIGGTADDPSKGKGKSTWEKIMEWGANMFGSIGNIISALMSVIFIAVAVVAIFLLLILAGELALLQEIELDDALIRKNIGVTIGSAVFVAEAITKAKSESTKEGEKKGGGILSWFLPDEMAAFLDMLASIMFIAVSLIAMALIIVLAKSMQVLSDLKLNDSEIKKNVSVVIGCAKHIADIVSSHAKANEDTDFDHVDDFNDMVEDTYDPMFKSIVLLCGKLNNLKNSSAGGINRGQIVKDIKNTIGVAIDIAKYLAAVDFNPKKVLDNIEILERTADSLSKFGGITDEGVENSKKVTDNYIRFIDKVNSSDFQKLNIAAKIFESFARLSETIKGDFTGLAEAVNENIMPVLEETQELLKKLPDELEKAGVQMSNSMNSAVNKLQASLTESINNYQQNVVRSTEENENSANENENSEGTVGEGETKWKKKIDSYVDGDRWKYDGLQDIIDILTGYANHGGTGLKVQTK